MLDDFVNEYLRHELEKNILDVAFSNIMRGEHNKDSFKYNVLVPLPGRTLERIRNVLDPQLCDDHICESTESIDVKAQFTNQDEEIRFDCIDDPSNSEYGAFSRAKVVVLIIQGSGRYHLKYLIMLCSHF